MIFIESHLGWGLLEKFVLCVVIEAIVSDVKVILIYLLAEYISR